MPMGVVLIGGLVVYISVGFSLAVAAFATPGSGALFGVTPSGLGAVMNTIAGIWWYLFPLLYLLGILIWSQDKGDGPRS